MGRREPIDAVVARQSQDESLSHGQRTESLRQFLAQRSRGGRGGLADERLRVRIVAGWPGEGRRDLGRRRCPQIQLTARTQTGYAGRNAPQVFHEPIV